MCPIVPCIFEHEKDGDLVGHGENGREGNGRLEPKILGHRVEEPDLWEFDSEVADQDELCAVPLLLRGRYFVLCQSQLETFSIKERTRAAACTHILNLVFVQGRYPVDDDPGQTAAEINELVHDEAHDPRR
nr:hypothetical protein CFP56_21770 [Quercus suber]